MGYRKEGTASNPRYSKRFGEGVRPTLYVSENRSLDTQIVAEKNKYPINSLNFGMF
jgi:hypothetical protein